MEMTAEERDARTVFVQQISKYTQPRALETLFNSVGHVRDVRIIRDTKTYHSKGIGYVEFWNKDAIPLALGLSGTKLEESPLLIQASMANLNRESIKGVGGAMGFAPIPAYGPLKLRIDNLHVSVNKDMLAAIFGPFGRVDDVEVFMVDNCDHCHGFVTFKQAEDARRALSQMNGFELAGRPMQVVLFDEASDESTENTSSNDLAPPGVDLPNENGEIPMIATQCFMLINLFDQNTETEPDWDLDIQDDIIDECNKYGGIVHIYVDKGSNGNAYIKCPSVKIAFDCVTELHGRIFAGRTIEANYIPVEEYHHLFMGSRDATGLLKSRE